MKLNNSSNMKGLKKKMKAGYLQNIFRENYVIINSLSLSSKLCQHLSTACLLEHFQDLTFCIYKSFSRGSSQPKFEPRSPSLQVDSLPVQPQGKPKSTGVGSLSLLQGNFLTQESNRGFLYCRRILYQLSYQGSLGLQLNIQKTKMMASIPSLYSKYMGKEWKQ